MINDLLSESSQVLMNYSLLIVIHMLIFAILTQGKIANYHYFSDVRAHRMDNIKEIPDAMQKGL